VYALLRKAKLVEPDAAEQAERRVRAGMVPMLRAARGFRLHLGFISEAAEAVGVTLCCDRNAAMETYEQVRTWVAENMRDLTLGEGEVRFGDVSLYRGGPQGLGGGNAALFVTIRQYEGVGASEEAVPLLSEHTLPVIERHPGFRAYYAFRDERDPHHAVSVSLWRDRGAALAAHQRVLEAMAALRDVFPTRPTITAGAARVIIGSCPGEVQAGQ
jgi:quinol monooxygenase YgiN